MGNSKLSKKQREDLVDELVSLSGRELSVLMITYAKAVGNRFKLNLTDIQCVFYVNIAKQPISAGDLAGITGLTTGAITNVIDRLEAAGFVKRERDINDRRLIIIKPVTHKLEEVRKILQLFKNRRHKMISLLDDTELIIIKKFMDNNVEIINEEITDLLKE